MIISLVLAFEKQTNVCFPNNILIFYINTCMFQIKVFTKLLKMCAFLTPLMLSLTYLSMGFLLLIAVAHESY